MDLGEDDVYVHIEKICDESQGAEGIAKWDETKDLKNTQLPDATQHFEARYTTNNMTD